MKNSFWKGKTVTAYIALKHHTRFIIPIMEKLADLGAKTNYLVGQAERSQEITAIETGLDYNHIFDYIGPSDREQVFNNYKMLRQTFGKALLEDSLFSLQVPTVMDKTLFALAQEYTGFHNYFKQVKPDICLALHELNRWGKIFSFHSKEKGIPIITLQEGLLTSASAQLDYVHTGHVQYSTLCLVWGQGSKEKLCHFESPEDRLIPVGNTHLSCEINTLQENNTREKKRKDYKTSDKFVMVVFFSVMLPQAIEEFIELVNLPGQNDSVELFFKFHPGTVRPQIDAWMERFPKAAIQKIHSIHGEEDTYSLMAMSDLCVLVEASTVGLEALAIGCALVLLNLNADVVYKDTSLVDKGAALGLTVSELCEAVQSKTSFETRIDQSGVQSYLDHELINTKNSIDRVCDLMNEVVRASQESSPEPLVSNRTPGKDWSIVIPVSSNPELFLVTLEHIALASEDENFEVILISPSSVPDGIKIILDSLGGDICILKNKTDLPMAIMMNKAAQEANGEVILFLDEYIAPTPGWLTALRNGKEDFGKETVFGAKVSNRFENIIHAGMVVNSNAQPVSAYLHLDKKFPQSCKTRAFQMVDFFIGMDRQLFLNTGGFHPKAGRYKYLDLSLRTEDILSRKDAVVYLHDIHLMQLTQPASRQSQDDAVFFYGKWHGRLWENEDRLYANDGISNLQLSAARMTRAQNMANRI